MDLPDRVVLEKLLRGQLAPEVAERLCRQLENEQTFACIAEEVMATDTFVDALKATLVSTDPAVSPEVARLIERFQSWDSEIAHGGTVAAISPTDPAAVVPVGPAEPTQIGHFRVVVRLGQGGMGAVYLGQDLQLNRKAALKVMRPEIASHPESRERFLREARAAAAIEHDNIVAIWQVGEDNGSPFIAMPFLLGESLDDLLKREPKSGVGAILKVARETAQGLAAAHDAGLIHRDIKPANLWVEGDPKSPEAAKAFRRVKILDFGLARASEDVQLTSTGAILGTPAFMSPEQGRGLPVDGRSDLFSLGVVLYRMATGKMPFTGDTMMALLTSLAVDTPVAPTVRNERVPSALSDLILKLLQKEPANRFQSAHEVVAAVQDVTRQLATRTAVMSSPESPILTVPGTTPPAPPRSRKSLWLGLGGAALVLLMGVIVITITDKDGKVTKSTAPETSKVEIAVVPDGELKAEPKKIDPKSVPAVVAGELPPLPKFAFASIPWGGSPFDKLDPKEIPKEERFNWQPKELVAVIGKHERRHWQGVNAVAISPDGKLAATATGGHPRDILHIYDVETQKLKWTLRGVEPRALSGYTSVCFSPDGKRLLVGNAARGYRLDLWDLTGDEPVLTSFGSDLPAGEPLKDLGEWARFMEGGKTLLVRSSTLPRKVQLFDISGGKPVHKTKDFVAYRIKTATAGNRVVYTTPEGKLRWAKVQNAAFVDDAELAIPFQPGPDNESLISLSDDGNTLMLWQRDHYELWNLAGAKPKKQTDIETTQDLAQNHEPQLSPDGRHFVTIHSPKLWKVDGREVRYVGPLNDGFPDAGQTAISVDGKRAVVGNVAGAVRFFDLSNDGVKELSPLVDPGVSRAGHYFMRYPTVLAKRGLIAVPIGGDPKGTRAQMWDLSGTKPRLWPDEPNSRVGRAGAYACPIEIVDLAEETGVIHEDGRLRWSRWTPKGSETMAKMEVNAATILRQYRPASKSAVVGDDKWANWRVWNVGEPIDEARPIRGLTSAIGYQEQTAFRPDRGLLAIPLPQENATGLWKPSGIEFVRTGTIPVHLLRPQFSPDGRWLLGITPNQYVLHLYDLKGERPVQILPFIYARSSTFSTDAKRFYYAEAGFSKLHCCELPSGRELWTIDIPEAPWWMQMAPDNRHLFLHNFNGTVYVLRLESPPDPLGSTDGFTSLFNGKDLSGWTGVNGTTDPWTVENGILTGKGNWSGHLFTEKSYGDVHIRVEARINEGGNSGVFARAPLVAGFPYGYEAQISSTRDDVRTGGLYYRGLKKVQTSVEPPKAGEWFTLELVVRKNVVTVFVNGKQSAELTDPDPEKPGRIALQKHDPRTVVEFRRVEIKTLVPPTDPNAPKEVPFFNGKDLTGWKGRPDLWRVKDGRIVGSTLPNGIDANTFLCSDREYGDFELRCRMKLDGPPSANSGIQIRSRLIDATKFVVHGPQCDAGVGFWGSLYEEGTGFKMLRPADRAVVAEAVRPDDFNELFVRCRGRRVLIRVNGRTTVDEEFADLPPKGIIAWQLLKGNGFTATIEGIEIAEFPASLPDRPNVAADKAEGVRPWKLLFNGTDLTGWEVIGRHDWAAAANSIVAEGRGKGWLGTVEEYADFELELEYKLPPKGNSGIFLRAWKDGAASGADFVEVQLLDDAAYRMGPKNRTGAIFDKIPADPAVTSKVGEWTKARVKLVGRHVTVTIGGVECVDSDIDLPRAKGKIGLQMFDTGVSFRNIFVRDLSAGPKR